MTNKGPEKIQKTDCCDQEGCCPSSADNTDKQPPGKKQWWKIGVFALGVVLILGATAYSLITRHLTASSAPLDTGAVRQISSNSCANALSTLGVSDLAWAQEVNSTFVDRDFIFVVLPENDSNLANTLANRISEATAKIEAQGDSVGTLTLADSDPEFSTTMKRLAIGQLPAVLAISTTGNGAIITGDITEGKLLQTYVIISQPICAPGSSSGCCPK